MDKFINQLFHYKKMCFLHNSACVSNNAPIQNIYICHRVSETQIPVYRKTLLHAAYKQCMDGKTKHIKFSRHEDMKPWINLP